MANDQVLIAELACEAVATPRRTTAGIIWRYHQAVLGLTILGLASLLLFEVGPNGLVRIPLFDITLRGMCAWQFITGFDCPLCGLTRCFVSMAHCRPMAALGFHAAGVGLFALVVGQIPYRIVQLSRLSQGRGELRHAAFAAAIWLLTAAIAIQWIVKVVRVFCA
jgi:hypothetical protein